MIEKKQFSSNVITRINQKADLRILAAEGKIDILNREDNYFWVIERK
ncbi:hypothetical protein LCGC14_2892610 [marine sediment metagenome]|uniref:Uncharacterized protein n=1 Tax=marine sediment metagenome TaxID=412755 RepID=A0A0F9A4P6_9ZZZZ